MASYGSIVARCSGCGCRVVGVGCRLQTDRGVLVRAVAPVGIASVWCRLTVARSIATNLYRG
ncbi:MAG: hypothetical protein HC895_05415 [Leptolyngbyaceae cyanobacterium SM1_3_5]|nr:hypothetical protein [Leptolyngbyaceae cyanobacterium SM1_3_5]